LGEELARALTDEAPVPTVEHSNAQRAASQGPTALSSHNTSESPGYGTVATHSARTEVAHDVARLAKQQPAASKTNKLIISIACAVVAIAAAVWLWQSQSSVITPVVQPSRQLNYSLLVQTNAARNPGKAPIPFAGEIVFTPGDQLRLIINSPQDGYLYIVNEGPQPKNGLPVYNFLFPDPAQIPADAPSLKTGKPLFIPSERPDEWFTVDKEQGTETLWLIWSDKSIAQLEAARKMAQSAIWRGNSRCFGNFRNPTVNQ
jgi:hypothetical protein